MLVTPYEDELYFTSPSSSLRLSATLFLLVGGGVQEVLSIASDFSDTEI